MADKNMEAQISVEFEEATSRQSLNSGETINTLWGKVKRWLSDLKVVCFSGSYNDLSDTPTTATKDTDGLMSAEDKSKLDGVATGANKTIVDTILSNTSTNPVQNKVVKQAIDNKADKTVATTSANGLMSAEDKVKLDNADDTYALKSKYGDTTINVGRKAGTIVGHFSTAEGQATTANSLCSHAEGDQTTASGNFSHSEGEQTKAIGVYSHAEGCGTEANGRASHAEGRETTAFGDYSHTSGYYTKALHDNEAAYGKYNESNDNTLFSIGDGTADDARHNAFEITATGGKLHDKDIATLDDIPTELPASNVTDIYSATGTEPVNGKAVASAISTKVDKISGKNLSTNDLTNTLKNNYDAAYTHSQSAHAPSSAQANVIETIKVNNTALTPTNKTVNITVPSNTDRYVNKAVFVDDSTATTASPIKMTLTRAGSDTNTITANIPKVSSSSAGVVPKGSVVSSQSKTTKFLREDGTWAAPSYTTNTDTKVTSVGNHYTPAKSTTKSASGGTLTDITNSTSGTQVVTGVEMDAKGHVTGVTSVALKSTDTKVTVDSALSSTSTNPVQNKVIKQAIDNKADKSLYDDTTINVGRKANTPVGVYSTAEGYYTTASGGQSHAEGNSTIANGVGAHAEGYNTIAGGDHSHAEGRDTTASGTYSHTEGWNTTASGICSHAGGGSYSKLSSVITDFSPETTNSDIVSAWTNTKFSLAKGDYSHSEGYNTLALELGSHAEGRNTIASGTYSHAEGYYTTASGENCSHAEGYYTIASGECSRAEGYYTTASSDCSHAEGRNTIASGICSHAEGNSTTASGDHSHTEGHGTTASGNCSYAGGFYTNALHNFEVAYGHYNVSNDDTLFSIGDGSADDARHNAFEITTTGGKLHDKDIATTDLIPTSLPANGGNADTVDGLHADVFSLKGNQVQFIPYNMLYYALNNKICLFANDDSVARGIYFINNSSSSITVCVLVSATAEGPVCQYGYGTNTYPEIQNTGENREWFTTESIPTSPVIYAMEVPPGKLGYYGFYFNSASTYTTVHDIRCPYFNFF